MTIEVKDDSLQIEKLSLGPYGTNAYIVTCLKTKASVLVDAPAKAKTIMEKLEGTEVKYILMTHNHMDHTGALVKLHSKLGVPLAAHEADAADLPVKPDMFLNDGDILSVGDLKMSVIHTPGHTPGCICFKVGKYLLSGDTIFNGGPGKSWSPADLKQVIESITTKIFTLPDDTQIFPGHGESTVLKTEKDAYAVFASKTHKPDLYGDIVWLTS
jgi:hydroxyacylglutathione hydrolase